jgi:hypothetical protein
MIRIKLLSLLSITALTVSQGRAADDKHSKHYMDCAKACDDCARICDACAAHCIKMVADGRKEHLRTARSCCDCAVVCRAAASITAHMGVYSETICTACADVCKRCGEECEKFKDDDMMKKCAEECRNCEKACREMLKHVTAGEKGR